jgi:hypothetical protein
MKNLTVRRRIIFGFSAVIVTMTVLSIFAAVLLYEGKGKATSIATDRWPGLYLSSQMGSLASDSVTSVYRFVLTGGDAKRPQAIVDSKADQAKLDELIKEYEQTSFRHSDRRILASIKSFRAECEAAYAPICSTAPRSFFVDS